MPGREPVVAVAIDGPAGAGKSTVARAAAEKLGFTYLDTGRMYRAVTWYLLRHGVNVYDPASVASAIEGLKVDLADGRITVNAEDATDHLRDVPVTAAVSAVSCVKRVRTLMVAIQRGIAEGRSIVMDGRDIGSVVLPDADVKIYLDAAVEERARRRARETGMPDDRLEEVENDIRRRDRLDSTRSESPLTRTPDAVVLDTTAMGPQEVVDAIVGIVRGKNPGRDETDGLR